MIVFISIFLGLVTGVKPVEFSVSGAVAEIEVRLDGELVGRLRGEPWSLECDFGELATHELVAIARDRRGAELDRKGQLINIPRPNVDARILLEEWQDQRPRSARLMWQSVEPVDPSSITVTLDGKVLADRYRERYVLPDLDPDSIHFLSARLEFPDNLSSTAEVVFGGVYGDSTETELTAVPLFIAGRKLRRLEQLQGRLEDDGEALRAFTVEDGPAEVVIVRDRRAIPRLATLDSGYAMGRRGSQRRKSLPFAGLAKGDTVLVMSPRPYLSIHPDVRYAVFPLSPPMTRESASIPSILANVKFNKSPVLPQRLTDAVATAGLRAASSQKRRAVVLVTTDCDDIPGQWSPEGVKRYLAQLRVPFRVWLLGPAAGAPASTEGFCDGAQQIDDVWEYYVAVKRLRRDLLGQQIVWVEGRHLQRNINLAGDEPGIRLAE